MIANSTEAVLSTENTSIKVNKLVKDYQNIVTEQRTEEQNIIYHLVPYSLDYLKSIQNNLMNHSDELKIVSSYIDESRNIIVVGYFDDKFDMQCVTEFIGNSEMIEFKKTDIPQFNAGTLVLRNGTGVESDDAGFTIACGAKLGNDYGFITAGYCGKVGTKVYYKNEYIGTITKSILEGKVDAAFIKRSSSNIKSTTEFTDGSAYKSGMSDFGNGAVCAIGSWPTGSSVVAYGSTTIRSTGKIKSTSYTANYSKVKVKLNDMVLTTCKSYPGDSGGAVKAMINYMGLTTVYLSGIISGHASENELIYTDIDYAKKALGCVGYYDTTNVK